MVEQFSLLVPALDAPLTPVCQTNCRLLIVNLTPEDRNLPPYQITPPPVCEGETMGKGEKGNYQEKRDDG